MLHAAWCTRRVAQELSAGFNLFEDDRNGTVAFEDFELVPHTKHT
jgi:Ca2+-binding EF-hand superfamily protein